MTRRHTNSPVLLIVEFCKAENSSECEEQQHGVQENEAGDRQPSHIYLGALILLREDT